MISIINKNYAYYEINDIVIPCFKSNMLVSKNVFADVYSYERTRRRMNYGTYDVVPKVIQPSYLNKFITIPNRHPLFEGYFDNLYIANRSYVEYVIP